MNNPSGVPIIINNNNNNSNSNNNINTSNINNRYKQICNIIKNGNYYKNKYRSNNNGIFKSNYSIINNSSSNYSTIQKGNQLPLSSEITKRNKVYISIENYQKINTNKNKIVPKKLLTNL